jgi:hypothetical protein
MRVFGRRLCDASAHLRGQGPNLQRGVGRTLRLFQAVLRSASCVDAALRVEAWRGGTGPVRVCVETRSIGMEYQWRPSHLRLNNRKGGWVAPRAINPRGRTNKSKMRQRIESFRSDWSCLPRRKNSRANNSRASGVVCAQTTPPPVELFALDFLAAGRRTRPHFAPSTSCWRVWATNLEPTPFRDVPRWSAGMPAVREPMAQGC